MNVYVLWGNSSQVVKYQFDGSKFQYKKYCDSIKKKGGRILDSYNEEDFKLIQEFINNLKK